MLHFEDFKPGQVFDLGEIAVDTEEMLRFARRFDPQYFHVDPETAAHSPFGAVIASGWFTGSLFMRAYVDTVLRDAVSEGSPGMEELRWLAPVYGGDVLRGRLEVLDTRPSQSRPNRGTVFLKGELLRGDTPVMRTSFRGLFGRRV